MDVQILPRRQIRKSHYILFCCNNTEKQSANTHGYRPQLTSLSANWMGCWGPAPCVYKRQNARGIASRALKISRNTELFGAQNQWEWQTWKELVLHSETKLSTQSCKFKTRSDAVADSQESFSSIRKEFCQTQISSWHLCNTSVLLCFWYLIQLQFVSQYLANCTSHCTGWRGQSSSHEKHKPLAYEEQRKSTSTVILVWFY